MLKKLLAKLVFRQPKAVAAFPLPNFQAGCNAVEVTTEEFWSLRQGETVLRFTAHQSRHILRLVEDCLCHGALAGYGVIKINTQTVLVYNPWTEDSGVIRITREKFQELVENLPQKML